ncbi:FAD-binding oxidoreductase [Kutzneria sp. NPDC052558]|uniref:FAD-binding oxidoreductase n=1 Tax=Kutzneria sp. NPDC052558 TaxID=3364121 RepID=UPI0037C68255
MSVTALRAALGDRVLVDSLDDYRHDRSGWEPPGRPSAVVLARDVADVQTTLRIAHEHRTPVVVRGAGTGLSGSATAVDGEIVLSTKGLDAITDLSPVDQTAAVQPGVITADLDRAAIAHGLRYAPDPGSVEISTIGGNIATNAGGLRCAKYGVTGDSVLGLDVVLADGTLLSTGRRTVKGVTGYDLTSLFVGSEGTLGVVVGATVRLRPTPPATATVAAYFDSVAAAAAASIAIGTAGIQPSVAELLDSVTLSALGLQDRGAALLLVQVDGYGARAEADAVVAAVSPHAVDVTATDDPTVADELVSARRLVLPSLEKLGRVLIEDIAVPRSRLADAVVAVGEIAARHGVTVATLAHAGDGNLHPIFVVDRAEPAVPDVVWTAAEEVFRLALRLGGTLTGEHGVGLLKRRWLADELGATGIAVQRDVKRLFDPHGILNPGKVF